MLKTGNCLHLVNRILMYLSEYLLWLLSHMKLYVKHLMLARKLSSEPLSPSLFVTCPHPLPHLCQMACTFPAVSTYCFFKIDIWTQRVWFFFFFLLVCEDRRRGSGCNVQLLRFSVEQTIVLVPSRPEHSINWHEWIFSTDGCQIMPLMHRKMYILQYIKF